MTTKSDNAGVNFPPPLLYTIPIVGGMLLQRRFPLSIPASSIVTVLATVLIVLWATLLATSLLRFRRQRTAILPWGSASTLVAAGAYRFTRNPMYLSFALLTIGIGLLFETWWPILLVGPTMFLIQKWCIEREEQYLLRRFGNDYAEYMKRVRRWL